MKGFIQQSLEAFFHQIDNTCSKVDGYAVTLGLDPNMVKSLKADRDYLGWGIKAKNSYQGFGHTWTTFADHLFHGFPGENILTVPVLPIIAAAPALVSPDVETRFSKFAAACKASANYTTTIGDDLGITAVAPAFDPNTGKPKVKAELHAGQPYLSYIKGKFHGVNVYKDSGSGYAKIDHATKSHYTDTTALPAEGQAVVWSYKLIFIWQDKEVGEMSDPVSVTVTGM